MTGQSFNLMTLGGLAAAVGLVIDDAIVILENIVLHRDAGEDRLQSIQQALREMTIPLVGSTITPIVVFLPLIAVTGVTGSFFRALAITMTVALFSSLVLALLWTPTLSQFLIRKKSGGEKSSQAWDGIAHRRLTRSRDGRRRSAQQPVFSDDWCVFTSESCRPYCSGPVILVASSLLIVVLSVVCYHFLGSDLLPAMDEGGFILDYYTPPGSSLAESNRILQHIEQILRETPEVENTSRRTGLQLGLAAVTEANRGDFTVRLKQKRDRGIDEIIDEVRAKIKQTEPAADVEFVQVLQDMIGDLTSAPEPVVIKMFSQDPQLLLKSAPRVWPTPSAKFRESWTCWTESRTPSADLP